MEVNLKHHISHISHVTLTTHISPLHVYHIPHIENTYNTYIILILHISHYVIPVDDLFHIPSAPAGIADGLYDDVLLYCAVLRDILRPIKL